MQVMERNSNAFKAAQDRFFWDLSYKYRKVLIPVVILLIMIGAVLLSQSYISMQMKVKQLSAFEPIYVLSAKRDIAVGEKITAEDLSATLYYKKEYSKVKFNTKDADNTAEKDEDKSALFTCRYENGQLIGNIEAVGRVAKFPILANSVIREEYLAKPGAMPGITNLIKVGHSLLNTSVPQIGFNVFIKPGDAVDLYRNDPKSGTKLIASDIEVILVDSLPMGQAPFQVNAIPNGSRQLTLSVPDSIYKTALRTKAAGLLTVTYKNKGENLTIDEETGEKISAVDAIKNFFQPLTLIKGSHREVHLSN